MLDIQDGFCGMQGGKTRRAPVTDIVYIKLFVGGLFFGLKKKKNPKKRCSQKYRENKI